MAFDSSTLASLVTTFRARYGIADDDARVSQPALLVTDDASTNTTSSTIAKVGSTITLVGDSTGTDTISLTSSTTVQDVADTINGYADGRSVDVVAPDPDVLASTLPDFAERSILSTSVLLSTSSDEVIEGLLGEALSRMETYCRTRLFDDAQTSLTETVWEVGDGMVVLPDAPVRRVEFFGVDTEQSLRVAYSGSGRATIEVTEDQTILLRTRPELSPTTVTEVMLGDDIDLSDVASDIGGVAGWSATVLNDGPSLNLVPMPPERVTTGDATLYAWVEADAEYRLDRDAGVVYLDDLTTTSFATNRAQGQARIRYRAGFRPLPADIEGVILAAAKAGLDASRRTFGVQSESLGDYSYSLAGSGVSDAIDEAIIGAGSVIGSYRRRLP